MATLSEISNQHHDRLEAIFQEVAEAAAANVDPRTLGELWTRFTTELRRHFEEEETELFPRWEATHPESVAELRQQHDAIRSLLAELDVAVDMHYIRQPIIDAFLAALRGHAAHEDGAFAVWEEGYRA